MKKRKTWDLTYPIEEKMPVYPGDEPPHLKPACQFGEAGFRETLLFLNSHTGTHMDAPAHVLPEGAGLEELKAERFWGRGILVDCRSLPPGSRIGMLCLAGDLERIRRAEYVLFYTGWERFWGQKEYFSGYPVPDEAVIEFLLSTEIKGVGFDTPSPDLPEAAALPNHRRFLGSGILLVENLRCLEKLLPFPEFLFFALPLKYTAADGAPVRAVALTEEPEDTCGQGERNREDEG